MIALLRLAGVSWLWWQEKNLDWFPRMQAMSLSDTEGDNEQNELRTLHTQLHKTNQLVATLSAQLSELREQVSCRIFVLSGYIL